MEKGPLSVHIGALQKAIEDALSVKHEHADPVVSHFSGCCWDWHSCVHGHWALLVLSGPSHPAIEALTLDLLKREALLLARCPQFENPYGRSWLVLLLDNLASEREDIREDCLNMKREICSSVVEHFQGQSMIQEGAQHQSLLFSLMLLKLANCSGMVDSMEVLAKRMAPFPEAVPKNSDFLFLPAVAHVAGIQQCSLSVRDTMFETLADFVDGVNDWTIENCHIVGALCCCLFGEQNMAHFDWILQRPKLWQNHFILSHWIPQFLVLAATILKDNKS